jgi:uncharacterized protein (DUF2236 family)
MGESIKLLNHERVFSPATMIWQVNRETVLLLAGGRALLMQLAQPKVAAGVAEYSHFKEDPLGRLHRTMSTMWSIVFDDGARARAALERVQNVHQRVRGVIQQAEPLPAGTQYQALDPELLLWVHATLVDSAMVAYDLFVKPLTADEQWRYYHDSRKLASLFEIPEGTVPRSLADFNAYMTGMLTGGVIAVGPTARSLAAEILHPRPWSLKLAGPLFALITAGLLPGGLREAYGLGWSEREEKKFRLLAVAIRRVLPFIPGPLRVVANARAAEKEYRVLHSRSMF